jgi:hypothetical protein
MSDNPNNYGHLLQVISVWGATEYYEEIVNAAIAFSLMNLTHPQLLSVST